MPYKPVGDEAVGPGGAHFALLMDGSGKRLAIRPGASLWLVEDKSDLSKIFPLTLRKVSVKKLQFMLPHPDGGASEYTYQLVSTKPLSKAALERLIQNRAGLATPKVQR